MDFNWLDIVVLVILLASVLISLLRGLIREMISLTTWIAAGALGVSFAPQVSQYLTGIDAPSVRAAVGFAVVFVAVLIVGMIVAFFVRQMVARAGISGADRVLGMVFGFARGVVIVAVLVLLGDLSPLSDDPVWRESFMVSAFAGISDWMQGFFPKDLLEHAESLL